MELAIEQILWVVGGYLSGSIPFGLILTKLFCKVDVRKIGSGNIGATNVLRAGNKKIAALTLLLDGAKAYVPTAIALYFLPETIAYWVATFSILGHIKSPWLKFKGGKGVASALGAYLALDPLMGLCVIIGWLIIGKIFKISSLSALVSFAGATLWSFWFKDLYFMLWALGIFLLILLTHRDNIKRLINGQEGKIKL